MSQKTLLITLVALIVVGIGGYFAFRTSPTVQTDMASSSPTATVPAGTSSPVTASPTPSPTPTPTPGSAASSSPTMITQADNNSTITLEKGERFGVAMGDTLDWSITFDPAGVVTRVTNISTIRGEQGVYTATAAGTTTLHAIGAPICNSGEACPQFRQAVTVTIVVR